MTWCTHLNRLLSQAESHIYLVETDLPTAKWKWFLKCQKSSLDVLNETSSIVVGKLPAFCTRVLKREPYFIVILLLKLFEVRYNAVSKNKNLLFCPTKFLFYIVRSQCSEGRSENSRWPYFSENLLRGYATTLKGFQPNFHTICTTHLSSTTEVHLDLTIYLGCQSMKLLSFYHALRRKETAVAIVGLYGSVHPLQNSSVKADIVWRRWKHSHQESRHLYYSSRKSDKLFQNVVDDFHPQAGAVMDAYGVKFKTAIATAAKNRRCNAFEKNEIWISVPVNQLANNSGSETEGLHLETSSKNIKNTAIDSIQA